MELTGDALVERTRALVRSLRDLTPLDATTVLIMAVACLSAARAEGISVEAYGERTKQVLIDQIKRLEKKT